MRITTCATVSSLFVLASLITGCGTNGLEGASAASTLQSILSDSTSRESTGEGPRHGPLERLATLLSLTEDQQAQAQQIFDTMHTDLEALREQGRADFEALLTADQLAQLEALRAEREADGLHAGPPPMMGGPMHGPGFGRPDPEAMQQARLDRLTEELGLSEGQVTQIAALQDEQRAAVEARRQQAKDEFRAILTDEQIAILDEIEASRQ